MRSCVIYLCALTSMLIGASLSFAGEAAPRILFDQGHGQLFAIGDTGDLQLSKLAETLEAAGTRVSQTTGIITGETLKDTAALILSGPFKPLQADEIEAVYKFMQNGGRIAVMLHIGHPLGGLLTRLGLDFSNSILHERRNIIDNDSYFRVTDLSSSPLFAGIDSFAANGVWAIRPAATSTAIARTSPDAWIDLDGDGVLSKRDAVGAFGVVITGAVGKGGYVVFGDDAIFQNRFLSGNNKKLAANLGMWLSGR